MNNKKLALRNKQVDPKSWQKYQESEIEPQIRNGEINGGVGYSQNQEFAMFRKTIKFLLEIITNEHPEVMYSDKYFKFMNYFNAIENIVNDFDFKT